MPGIDFYILWLIKESQYTLLTCIQGTFQPGCLPYSITAQKIAFLCHSSHVIMVFDPSVTPAVQSKFLIYISSPSSRLKISKDINVHQIFMNPWTIQEILQNFTAKNTLNNTLRIYMWITEGDFSPGVFDLKSVLLQPNHVKKLIQRCTATLLILDDYYNEENQWLTHIWTASGIASMLSQVLSFT